MTGVQKSPAGTGTLCGANDLVCTGWACAVWCASGFAFAAGFSTERWRPVLWIASLGVTGALCLVNAARCHRLHCYITGPVTLLGALLTALNATGVTHIPWRRIGWGVVIGVALGFIAELLGGKYARGAPIPPH
ncbi:MAG TPA: hypothetical protein VGU63_02705 [Candidatus Acidoferrales bacterium]|nr:hypothetical protein [Candidatus Acidoferrales bacterium]